MEPFSIAASVASLVTAYSKTIGSLKAIANTYKSASLTISAITSECSVTSVALSRIQYLFLHNLDSPTSRLDSQSQLNAAFETALTGCSVILVALDGELQKLAEDQRVTGESPRLVRPKYTWNEDIMKELLQHLRGQHEGINLLLTALQM
jgi:hypothetical protein